MVMMAGGWSGTGKVDDRYSWTENEIEIEIIVPVPEGQYHESMDFHFCIGVDRHQSRAVHMYTYTMIPVVLQACGIDQRSCGIPVQALARRTCCSVPV